MFQKKTNNQKYRHFISIQKQQKNDEYSRTIIDHKVALANNYLRMNNIGEKMK